jgi:excisionase family DNA binding protein
MFLPPLSELSLNESLLDANDVGKRLRLSPRTVADMANDGRLPAYRLGIYLRFKWADIDQFITANCKVATQGGAQ